MHFIHQLQYIFIGAASPVLPVVIYKYQRSEEPSGAGKGIKSFTGLFQGL